MKPLRSFLTTMKGEWKEHSLINTIKSFSRLSVVWIGQNPETRNRGYELPLQRCDESPSTFSIIHTPIFRAGIPTSAMLVAVGLFCRGATSEMNQIYEQMLIPMQWKRIKLSITDSGVQLPRVSWLSDAFFQLKCPNMAEFDLTCSMINLLKSWVKGRLVHPASMC